MFVEPVSELVRGGIVLADRLPQLQEEIALLAEMSEDASNDFLYAVYDQRHIRLRDRGVRKWKLNRTTVKQGLCWHHTGVHPGFAPRRRDINRFLAKSVAWDNWRTYDVDVIDHEAWARAEALGYRYRQQSYHCILAPNSVLYLNLPFDVWSYHGDGSNRHFIGCAWDGHSGRNLLKDATYVRDLRKDVKTIVDLARQEGHPIREFTCHSAYANKPRDPDAFFINEVLVPVARDDGDIFFRWDFLDLSRAKSLRETLLEKGIQVPTDLSMPEAA